MDIYDTLSESMHKLGLNATPEKLAGMCIKAAKEGSANVEFLTDVISVLLREKHEKSFEILMKLSNMPRGKTLDNFDFSFQPSLDESRIRQLASLDFVRNHENVIFVAKPGRGKSHLATSLGVECCKQGYKVYMSPLGSMIDKLKAWEEKGMLTKRKWGAFEKPAVLIIDDVASRRIDKQGCELFAEVISRRYEKASIILTSNRPFSEWPRFYDPAASEETIDKLVHHSVIITIDGPSFRLKEKLSQLERGF